MIKGVQHKGLKRYWNNDNPKLLNQQWLGRIEMVLLTLDDAEEPEDMNLPGLNFHGLTGDRKGEYSVLVTKNWRITTDD